MKALVPIASRFEDHVDERWPVDVPVLCNPGGYPRVVYLVRTPETAALLIALNAVLARRFVHESFAPTERAPLVADLRRVLRYCGPEAAALIEAEGLLYLTAKALP